MDVKYVNPFLEAFTSVMPQLGFQSVNKTNVSVEKQEIKKAGVVIIVGIVGAIKGNVVYCIDMEGAKSVASTMMMGMPIHEFDEMAQSALSELANMLTANAATIFFGQGIQIDISTPAVLFGDDITIKMSSNQVLCIRLTADQIPIEINIAFEQ